MSDNRNYAEGVINEAFGKYYTEIYRFCLSYLTKDRASVEDCVQETFVVLYKKLVQGEQVENIRAYLYKIAENVTRTKQRELKKHGDYVNLDEITELSSHIDEITERLSFEEYSRQISDALSDKEAELFRLRYIEDMPIDEIARIMNTSFSATGTRLHRLKKKIAIIINELIN